MHHLLPSDAAYMMSLTIRGTLGALTKFATRCSKFVRGSPGDCAGGRGCAPVLRRECNRNLRTDCCRVTSIKGNGILASGTSDLARFRTYLQFLARLAWNRRLQAKLDPSDIVQQTLLLAHQRLDQIQGQTDAEVAAWLRQILANVLAEQHRYFHRGKRNVSAERSMDAVLEESSRRLGGWDRAEPTPDQKAEFSERAVRIAEAIEGLAVAQRDALVLHYWQGHSISEVASILERSPAAVGGLVHRGLTSLRQKL